MKRLTTDKPVKEMSMTELAHNCMIAKDGWAVYRDYDQEIDLLDFMRQYHSEAGEIEVWPNDNEALGEMLSDCLQNPLSDPDGLYGFMYRNLWAMADLRERLKKYEDTGVEPEQIRLTFTGLAALRSVLLTGKAADTYTAAQAAWIPAEKEKPTTGSYERLWLTIEYSGEYKTVEGRYDPEWDAFTYSNQQSITAGRVIAWKKYHEPEPCRPEGVN